MSVWKPNPGPQTELLQSPAFEIFYGGARGGGKTDGMLADACAQASPQVIALRVQQMNPDWSHNEIMKAAEQAASRYKAIFFRRTLPELNDLIERAKERIPKWFPGAKYRVQEKIMTFPSGAQMLFRYLKKPDDWRQYQGHEYTWVGFEELVNFPDDKLYMTLFGACRTSNPFLKCYMRSSGNPWGPGLNWVKNRFVDIGPAKKIHKFTTTDPFSKRDVTLTRQFIPAAVKDNPVLMESDPQYVARLMTLPEREQRAMLHGDWDAAAGMVFGDFDRDTHVISWKDFQELTEDEYGKVPEEWPVYMSFDWGWGRPFSVGWWAIDPYNRAFRIYEWYGATRNAEGRVNPNEGLRLRDEEIAFGIMQREEQWGIQNQIALRVADPSGSVFNERVAAGTDQRGPSCADIFAEHGIYLERGDNNRIAGKMQLHHRLAEHEVADDVVSPMLYILETCTEWLRTVPSLPANPRNPDDIDTDAEDHSYDETRYFLMCRPVGTEDIVDTRPRWLVESEGQGSWRTN